MSNRKGKTNVNRQSSEKGKILEMIVAGMHDNPDVKIERNVRIPTVNDKKRRREIDVLMTGNINGYPIRMVIECKNYISVINIPHIDAFIGKLQDIGIPSQQGIYVTPIGFSEGAKNRAKEVGIIPLVLTGLTPDRLSEKIIEAIQSVIYIMAEVTQLAVSCNMPKIENIVQMWFLYDGSGKVQATLPDLVWMEWIAGKLPTKLGEIEVEILNPKALRMFVDGKYVPLLSAKAKVKITAIVLNIQGRATEHTLTNPVDQTMNRFTTDVTFDNSPKTYPINSFDNEEELQKYITTRQQKIKLTIERIKLPRIRFYQLYWPLSFRAVTEFAQLDKKCHEEGRDISNEEIAGIEGSDLKTMWDPIIDDNPVVRELLKLSNVPSPK